MGLLVRGGERFLLSVTIANADYMAIGSVYFLEYEGKRFTERTIVKPFARKPVMPETVCGDIELAGRNLSAGWRAVARS